MLIAVFQKTVAEEVVESLGLQNVIHIKSSEKSIKEFVSSLKNLKQDKLLVLAQYFGKNQEALRIETQCTNVFKNRVRGEVLVHSPIPYFLQPTERVILSDTAGDGWCNLLCYEIVSAYPNLPFTFLHIPKKFPKEEAVKEVEKLISFDI